LNKKGAVKMIAMDNLDLFARIPVSDYAAALQWYQQLLGYSPAFFPHDTDAVWELAEHRYLYVVEQPEHAGHAMHTLISQIGERGLNPSKRETYENGVRKITYVDADGNEIGFGSTSR
jgi:catechol 2,3-dioxygenase-like lactoylglutathione lyase family enzyme